MKDKNAWSLDHYLAKQIAEGCEKLRLWKHGHPTTLTHEEWLEILLKIQSAFWTYHTKDEKEMTWEQEKVFLEGEFREAKELFIKWYEHLWD